MVTVKEPELEQLYTYVLVQRGTPVPDLGIDAMVIEIPVKSIVALSTTHLPALEITGELEKLKAVNSFNAVNTPVVREMIDEGRIKELGSGMNTNTELIVSISPEIIMTTTTGVTDYDEHIKELSDLGLKPVINIEYKESDPLGRAEWVKYISLFFNKEKEANAYFSNVSALYNELKSKTASVENKPTVMSGDTWEGIWYTPGGNSFVAQYLEDAGAIYFMSEDNHTASVPLDYEVVFDKGKDADYWISSGMWDTLDEVVAEDPVYAQFKAVKDGNMYTNYFRVNEHGGNDYYESGLVRPEVVLADLVRIFHPELVPEHDLVYFKQLEPISGGNEE